MVALSESLMDMIIFQDQDRFNANRGKAVHGIQHNEAAQKFVSCLMIWLCNVLNSCSIACKEPDC